MAQSISNTSTKSIFKNQYANSSSPFKGKISNPNGIDLSGVRIGQGGGVGSVPVSQLNKPQVQQPQAGYVTPTAQATPSYTQPMSTPTKGLLTPPAQTQSGNTNTFQSLIAGLTDSSRANKAQEKLLKDLQTSAQGNQAIGEDARRTSQMYADEIKRVGNLGAGAQAGYLSTGSNVVGAGNAAIASQSVSQRMNALAQAQQAALEGTSQQFTGQQQTANALNQALQGANTQQQLGISGFGTAAGLAAPSPAGFGQTTFNPLTGSFGGGSQNLDPQMAASQLAQQVMSGQMSYDQAVQSLGYAGGAGQQMLNQALQGGGGFNIAQSQANLQGQLAALQQLPAMEGADVAAEGVKNKINAYLAENPQLNPTSVLKANVIDRWLKNQLETDPKYQTLSNYLNEYTSTLAPILGVGGETTNLKTQIAQEFINASASGASISEVLENIQNLSRGKINDLRSGITGGGAISNPNAGGGTGSGGEFDW